MPRLLDAFDDISRARQAVLEPLALAALIAAASPVEERYALPAGLLVAVVMLESSGRVGLVVKRRCGYDVGAGQLHIHGNNISRQRIQRLLVLSTNLDLAGAHLARSRERCRARPRWAACRACPEEIEGFGLYNGGAAKRWCARLSQVYNRIKRATQRLEPLGALTPQRTLTRPSLRSRLRREWRPCGRRGVA